MAAASTQKLQDIVECPICLETLTEPRMFTCFHFYCQKCVNGMKEIKQNCKVGYTCPLCRQFTAKDQLHALPIMNQLMEAIAQSSADKKCGTCSGDNPTCRCLDCKDNFCDTCRADHNKFKALQHHKWQRIDSSEKAVIDEVAYCQVHPSKPVEIHCRDCKQLVCLLCNGTTHKTHSAETIEEALQQILPVVKDNQLKVKAMIRGTQARLHDIKQQEQETKRMHQNARKEVHENCKEFMQRLKEDCDALLKEIDASEQKAAVENESHAKQLELKLQSQENVLSLSQSTLDTAQNISLLKALQSGVLDSLKSALKVDNSAPTAPVEQTVLEFKKMTPRAKNFLGTISKSHRGAKHDLELSFDQLMTTQFSKQAEHSLGINCGRFSIFNGELWLTESYTSNISILSLNGTKKYKLTFDEMGEIRALTSFKNKALVSAERGLFTVSTNQRHDVRKVVNGNFCDAAVSDSLVYALRCDQPHVVVIRHNDKKNSFVKKNDFQLVSYMYSTSEFNTIQATSDHVFVACFASHVIYQYTMDGKLVSTHGRPGNSSIGELQNPLLTGSDQCGNLLIAGGDTHRIDVLKADGEFQSLPVTGMGQQPMCARTYMNSLYVVLWGAKALQTFAIE